MYGQAYMEEMDTRFEVDRVMEAIDAIPAGQRAEVLRRVDRKLAERGIQTALADAQRNALQHYPAKQYLNRLPYDTRGGTLAGLLGF